MTRPDLGRDLTRFVADTYFAQNFRISSDSTRRHYRIVLADLAAVLGRSPTIGDLTDETICRVLRFVASRVDSAHTVDQRRSYLVALSNWCSRRGYLPWWVSVERYPTPEISPEAWTLDQVQALWAACERFPGDYCGIRAAHWWKAFHAVLWDCGERTEATLAVEWDWLAEDGWLRIPARVRKGRRKPAAYRLKPLTLSLLAAMRTVRKLVFEFPGCQATFYGHYGRLLRLAGLPDDRRSKPQRMRRTFASHLEAAGGDATAALGHSSRRVTERSYLDPRIVQPPPPNRLLPALEPALEPPPLPPPIDED